jgi:hypothetical protein
MDELAQIAEGLAEADATGLLLTVTATVVKFVQPFTLVTFNWYKPAIPFGITGFWRLDAKVPGPLHVYVVAVDANNLMVSLAQ